MANVRTLLVIWCLSLFVGAPVAHGADNASAPTLLPPASLPPAPLPELDEPATPTPVSSQVSPTAQPANAPAAVNSSIPKLAESELDALVASIAFYPDAVLDRILDAVQAPVAIKQGAELLDEAQPTELSRLLGGSLPASVDFLRKNHPDVLRELNRNLLLMSRLGLAVQAQPGDVVAAVRRVRAAASSFQAQTADSTPSETPGYALPATSLDSLAAGVAVNQQVYPCYSYYTYGVPGYDYGYGTGYYPGYGYGYGYSPAAILAQVTRLTLGIIYLSRGPYYYGYGYWPWYGYAGGYWPGYGWGGYPYYGYGWGYGTGWGGYPYYGYGGSNGFTPYPVNNVGGPRWSGWQTSQNWTGPYGAQWRSGTTTGQFQGWNGIGNFATASNSFGWSNGLTSVAGGRGVGQFNLANGRTVDVSAAGIAGRTQWGPTTHFGGAGTISAYGSGGRGGTASGWLTGQSTVVGNATSWHTQAAGRLNTIGGISGTGTHAGGGSLVAFADGSYGWNRQSTNTWSGRNGDFQTVHNSSGVYRGGGQGSYAGSTEITGDNGRGGTINTTFQNGKFDVDVSRNNPANLNRNGFGTNSLSSTTRLDGSRSPANRLSGTNGQAFNSSLARLGNNSAASASGTRGSTFPGLRNSDTQGLRGSLGQNLPRTASTGSPSTGSLGERFGGFGPNGANGTAGLTGSRLGSAGPGRVGPGRDGFSPGAAGNGLRDGAAFNRPGAAGLTNGGMIGGRLGDQSPRNLTPSAGANASLGAGRNLDPGVLRGANTNGGLASPRGLNLGAPRTEAPRIELPRGNPSSGLPQRAASTPSLGGIRSASPVRAGNNFGGAMGGGRPSLPSGGGVRSAPNFGGGMRSMGGGGGGRSMGGGGFSGGMRGAGGGGSRLGGRR